MRFVHDANKRKPGKSDGGTRTCPGCNARPISSNKRVCADCLITAFNGAAERAKILSSPQP